MRSKYYKEEHAEAVLIGGRKGICAKCEEHDYVTEFLTSYHYADKKPHDLCFYCAEEVSQAEEEQWNEYYSSVMGSLGSW